MKLHYLAIAAVTAISANIGPASAAVSFLSINTCPCHVYIGVTKTLPRTLLPTYLYHRHLTSHLALSANHSLLGVL